MGFERRIIFVATGTSESDEVLRVTLKDGRHFYVVPTYGNHPYPEPYIVPVDLTPKWLQEWYDAELRRYLDEDPDIIHFGPASHAEATGSWAIRVTSQGDFLSPDVPLFLKFGHTHARLEFQPEEICGMMPTTLRQALAVLGRLGTPQPAHS